MRLTVGKRHFHHHLNKKGESCVRIEWLCAGNVYKSYASFASEGGLQYVKDFWEVHYGKNPFPRTADEFLNRQEELGSTDSIEVYRNGKFWNVSSSYRAKVRTRQNIMIEDHIGQFAKSMGVSV